MKSLSDYMQILTALFVIINPIGAVPLFASLTRDQDAAGRHRIVRVTATAVAVVLILAVFLGDPLLKFFGIGLPAFRVGGGILILMMAISMLRGHQGEARQPPAVEGPDAEDRESMAVVPLAIPMLAGPGAISTTIVYAHQAHSAWDYSFLVFASLVVAGSVWIALYLAEPIIDRLGRYGINVTTRVMGLILAAVAVEFIANGIGQLFPKLV